MAIPDFELTSVVRRERPRSPEQRDRLGAVIMNYPDTQIIACRIYELQDAPEIANEGRTDLVLYNMVCNLTQYHPTTPGNPFEETSAATDIQRGDRIVIISGAMAASTLRVDDVKDEYSSGDHLKVTLREWLPGGEGSAPASS